MDKLQSDASDSLFADMREGYEVRSKLSEITNGLKLNEKISVVFLLCIEPRDGLVMIESMLNGSNLSTQNDLFYKWMRKQWIFADDKWRENLGEVLTVIQNYRLAKILGYEKSELKERFMLKNNFKTFSITSLRKVLYNLCENLTKETMEKLVTSVESSHNVSLRSVKWLEVKLLQWSENSIINLEKKKEIDLSALITCLKSLGLNNFIHDIEVVVEKTNCYLIRSKFQDQDIAEAADYYQITDIDNIGLCVIINEKNFINNFLLKRWGSDKDVERLIEVFTAFGFDIKIYVDLTRKQLINILKWHAERVDKNISFFVLIILSHGSENVIYTSDLLPVDMNTIEMIFQAEVCQNLIGKPKIFIVQSCQGDKWQKVHSQNENSDIEPDNCVTPMNRQMAATGPQRGDSMIAWSTVQGFASFRDRYNGSWYIQELCNELWKYGDALDLVEIFTRVNNNLRSKVYNGQLMVPSLLLSLRAKIRFPHLRENFSKGRRLMLDRLIFDKYFRMFLKDQQPELEALFRKP